MSDSSTAGQKVLTQQRRPLIKRMMQACVLHNLAINMPVAFMAELRFRQVHSLGTKAEQSRSLQPVCSAFHYPSNTTPHFVALLCSLWLPEPSLFSAEHIIFTSRTQSLLVFMVRSPTVALHCRILPLGSSPPTSSMCRMCLTVPQLLELWRSMYIES